MVSAAFPCTTGESAPQEEHKSQGQGGDEHDETGGANDSTAVRLEVRELDLVPSAEIANTPDEDHRGTADNEDGGEVGDHMQARDERVIGLDELRCGQSQHDQAKSGPQPGEKGSLVGQVGSRPAVGVGAATHARFSIPRTRFVIGGFALHHPLAAILDGGTEPHEHRLAGSSGERSHYASQPLSRLGSDGS